MNKINIKNLPRPGLRNIKTAIAIILCISLYRILGWNDVILATIAALICMQDSVEKSVKEGFHRVIGTTMGGLFGVLFMYLPFVKVNFWLWIGLIFVGLVTFIYCCNLFHIKDSIIIGCVVFLIIVLEADIHIPPILYAINRILDTFVGIAFAVAVNYFLFRPKPDRLMNEVKAIEPRFKIVRAGKHKISNWSGGTTTELFIYPEDCLYGDRDFEWRISTATIQLMSSTFTKLPGYMRRLMMLEGRENLNHEDNHRVTLEPFDQDYFDGGWTTKSYGRGTDFNLMLKKGREGYISAISPQEERVFNPELFTAFYILADRVALKITSENNIVTREILEKNDFIMFYPVEENHPLPLTVSFEDLQEVEVSFCAIETLIFPVATQEGIT